MVNKNIIYKYYQKPDSIMDDISFPLIEIKDPLIEVKVIHNAENMFIAEIPKLSIYEVGKSYREVENKLRNSIRQTYNNRNEFS
jgi:hypothetical protein